MDVIPGLFALVLILGVSFIVYFFPYLIARQNKKQNEKAILALNLFLGWTIIGWVAALVWALSKDVSISQGTLPAAARPSPLPPPSTPPQKKCPGCAEMVLGEAKKCRFCGHAFDTVVST